MSFIQNIELDWTDWKAVNTKLSATVFYLQNDLQYVPFIPSGSSSDTGEVEFIYYVNVNRDPSSVSGPYAALSSGAQAHATIQDITYTAIAYGSSSVTIQYTNTAPAVGQESVTVLGNAITVHIVSGKSTAQQVVSAVVAWSAYSGLSQYNSAASAELVSAIVSGNPGNPQTTQGPTSLSGGASAVTVLSDWTTNFLGTATKVGSFMDGVAQFVAA